MENESNFINLPIADMFDLGPNLGLETLDPGLDMPILSMAEVEVESNPSASIMNRPKPNSISPFIDFGLIDNDKQLDPNNLGLPHLDRKHKLDHAENSSPPKVAKVSSLINSSIGSPHDLIDENLTISVNHGNLFNKPNSSNEAEHLPLSGHNDFKPIHNTVSSRPRPTFNQDSFNALDLNHTVTNLNNHGLEQVTHIIDPIERIAPPPVTPSTTNIIPKNLSTPGTSTNNSTTITSHLVADSSVISQIDNEEFSKEVIIVEPEPINNIQKTYNEIDFQQLIEIFPEADEDFIKEQCRVHLNINSIIEVILGMNSTYPKKKKNSIPIQQEKNEDVVLGTERNIARPNLKTTHKTIHQEQLEFLSQIFLDADPQFLETKSKLSDSDLKTFVSDALENNNYPKLEKTTTANVKKEDSDDDLGLYTSSFDIRKFLQVVKDPFSYYLDDNRECHLNTHALEFMKRRYRKHSIKLINIKYREYKYNLSKTCDFLDTAEDSRSTKRSEHEIKMPPEVNRPFLQEACFVEHKKEIKDYLEKIENEKKAAYALAEERHELIECGCCYQELLFEECATCNEGDLFCKTCIQKSAEVRIGDGLTTFPCLIDCGSSFSLNLLQDLLEPQVFSRLLKRIQLDEVKAADIEGLEVCPFCEFATIPAPETKIFICMNPECLKESCRQCHKMSHIPKRCDEIENDDQERARKYIEDEMTRALVRECYKCKKSFIKTDGCNKMTCTCGAKMCYICRQPITDYKHFNGPGGDQTKKCPLYSTEKVLHVDAVADIAKKALEKVKADNPDLKLVYDPSKDLPSSTQASTTLPPGVVEAPAAMVQRLNNFAHYVDHMIPMPELVVPLLNVLGPAGNAPAVQNMGAAPQYQHQRVRAQMLRDQRRQLLRQDYMMRLQLARQQHNIQNHQNQYNAINNVAQGVRRLNAAEERRNRRGGLPPGNPARRPT